MVINETDMQILDISHLSATVSLKAYYAADILQHGITTISCM